MTIFFTSDSHFGHKNIIEICNRPFPTVREMDWTMIRRWNERVKPGDTVYHLGDLTLDDAWFASSILSQLNGGIHVLSNPDHHDKRWIKHENPWVILLPPIHNIYAKRPGHKHKKPIVLSHFPLATWDRMHYNSWHLHGHSHGTYIAEGFILDVGVDCHNFYPVSLEEVIEIMEKKDEEAL